jgi:WD40 repeat protein/serine/threonine protein kinase
MENLTGRVIRGYELHERIGEGGFGVVYRAHQTAVKRDVVIKAVLPVYANNPEFIRNFEAEAQLIARLEHLHIVPLYDYWRDHEGAFLVMRWLRGGSLLESLRHGAWSIQASSRMLNQIAGALTTAHRNNVVHQDIKPANILLDEDGNAFLTDFGLANDLKQGIDLSVSSASATVRGSPAYISPEQIRRDPISPRTDIYSLGIVLYEVLCGEHPFGMTNVVDLLRHQLNSQLPPLQSHRSDLPDALNRVLRRATAKDPDARYASVVELVEAFEQAITVNVPTNLTPAAVPNKSLSQTQPITGVISLDTIEALYAGPRNPYKGLRAFQEADAADFFGRASLVNHLLQRLQTVEPYHRFLALVGPSGSGKSSVIHAGLLPAIRRGKIPLWNRWFLVEMSPGSHPIVELTNALLKIVTGINLNQVTTILERKDGLNQIISQHLPDQHSELILFIDQFEETFALVADEFERSHFFDLICEAVQTAEARIRVIITLRADFYDRPLLHPRLGELLRTRTELVLPMSQEEILQTIVEPAEQVGLTLENGLAERIAAEVIGQPSALPLLQFALTELYEHRQGKNLTIQAYEMIGGVSGALARRADDLYNSMNHRQQQTARQIFLRLIAPGSGSENTRRRALQSELLSLDFDGETVQSVLDEFGKYRLLSFDRDPLSRAPTVEIAHEALIRKWQMLRLWIDQSQDQLRTHRQLAVAVNEWIAAQKDTSFLASGARLAQFEVLLNTDLIVLNETERSYLDTSVARQRRLERNRQLRFLIANAAAIIFVLLALAALQQRNRAEEASRAADDARATAVVERDRADQEALIAHSRELAALAMNENSNVNTALLLSLEALKAADTFEARHSLMSLLQQYSRLKTTLTGHTDTIRSVAFSPDGQRIASGSRDGSVRLWDANRLIPDAHLSGHTGWVNTVAFSPDGRWLASGGIDGSLFLWDLRTAPIEARPLEGHRDAIWSVAFSPDSQTLVSGGADRTLRLWSSPTGRLLQSAAGHTDTIYAVSFSHNGQWIASGGADTTIRLSDASTLETARALNGHTNWIYTLTFSPDDQYLASGGVDTVLRLWDLYSETAVPQSLSGHLGWIRTVQFTPNGQRLITGGADGAILIWDTAQKTLVDGFTSAGARAVWSLAIHPENFSILTGGADPNLYIWDQQPQPGLATLLSHQPGFEILALAADPGGSQIAFAGDSDTDFSVKIQDIAVSNNITLLTGHTAQVTGLAYSPTHPYLFSVGVDKQLIVWDTQTHQRTKQFDLPESVFALALRPDGQQLALGYNSGSIQLWDLEADTQEWQPGTVLAGNPGGRIMSLAYHPTENILASGNRDGSINIWNNAGPPVSLTGHTDGILGLAFSQTGMLASVSRDQTIRLWSQQDTDWLLDGPPLTGHTNWVMAVAFAPDAAHLASVSTDGSAILWDIERRLPVGSPLIGHSDWINAVTFSVDGQHLYTAGRDGRLIAWSVDPSQWYERACQLANRNLNADEQQRFLGATLSPVITCPQYDRRTN